MMTDTEILNYFTTLTHDKVCGRALPSQLNRDISCPKEPKKRLFWYWNYIVMFFMFFSKSNATKAQGGIKPVTEISNIPSCKAGETEKNNSRVIIGKVTDIDGNPVSFASVKIKGQATGLSADANGGYSIKAENSDILVISGMSFKTTEVTIGERSIINTVLEKGGYSGEIIIVATAGGISYRYLTDYAPVATNSKYIAVLKVKDDKSALSIEKAKISITKNGNIDPGTFFTDKKGVYKLSRIEKYDQYYVKVEADGYETNEFTIAGNDFEDRKKDWEIFLRKQKTEPDRSIVNHKSGQENTIRMGGVSIMTERKELLYVVDGTIIKNVNDINIDDIEDIAVLQGSKAAALFGPEGINGAIVITTKKAKIKNLDTVVVASAFGSMKTTHCSASKQEVVLSDLNDSNRYSIGGQRLNVYPNPVQRGNTINISLQLKQTGVFKLKIIDATGRIVLVKQINANSKEYAEKLQTDDRWSSGVYYISISDNKNQLISNRSFIVR